MKTIFYITGTSRGIGKSIAELALMDEDNFVFGYSRTQTINHANYKHISSDFSNPENLMSLELPVKADASKAVLINNAGMLGQVKPIGSQDTENIIKTHTVNAIAPTIITNLFLNAYKNNDTEKTIINISSGAARKPVESWANYCSTKASLDMLSRVVQQENADSNLRVFAVAPGVVDTKMQDEIRSVSSKDFPHLEKFLNYKTGNHLSNTKDVANMLMHIINNPQDYGDVLMDVREL
ncbi:MAG: SDR family NAD(P)-dependent oxidoreductase [Bacteroidales bacterium]